jgi:hypothetical protein
VPKADIAERDVSMNERGCPCLDHATACADRNHGRKIRGRYPPVFPTRGEALFHEMDQCREMEKRRSMCHSHYTHVRTKMLSLRRAA